ncbi:MAG: carbohydrate kinase family protein [bacterium]
MKKVLTIGSGTQDIFIDHKSPEFMTLASKGGTIQYALFESGEKIEVENIDYHTGGGSTNSSVSFKRLGFDSTCFCQIGSDTYGENILNDLKKEKVNITNIVKTKTYSSGVSFIINSAHGERTIFAYRGANAHVSKNLIPFSEIKKQDLIYITSLSNDSAKLLPDITKFAKENKITVAINPGISQLTKGTLILKKSLKYIDIFIMNSTEAKQFMTALIETDENYKKLLESSRKTFKECKEHGPCLVENPILYENTYFSIYKFVREVLKMGPKIVVITNGENGVYVGDKKEILFHPSIKTKVIDSVGAGDSFGSCFVASLQLGYKIEEALKFAMLNSSSVISQLGAKTGLLKLDQIKKRTAKLNPKLLKRFKLR